MNIADRELWVVSVAQALGCPEDSIGVISSTQISGGVEIFAEVPDMPPALRHPHIVVELGTVWRKVDPREAYLIAIMPVRKRIMAEREARSWSACDQ